MRSFVGIISLISLGAVLALGIWLKNIEAKQKAYTNCSEVQAALNLCK